MLVIKVEFRDGWNTSQNIQIRGHTSGPASSNTWLSGMSADQNRFDLNQKSLKKKINAFAAKHDDVGALIDSMQTSYENPSVTERTKKLLISFSTLPPNLTPSFHRHLPPNVCTVWSPGTWYVEWFMLFCTCRPQKSNGLEKSSTSKATAADCLHTTNTRVARLRWPVSRRRRRPVARLSIVGVARAGVTRVCWFWAEPLYSGSALGHVRQRRKKTIISSETCKKQKKITFLPHNHLHKK